MVNVLDHQKILLYSAGLALNVATFIFLTPSSIKNRVDFGYNLSSIWIFSYISYLAVMATYTLCEDADLRTFEVNFYTVEYLHCYLGQQVVGTAMEIINILKGRHSSGNPVVMMVHHAISMSSYYFGLTTGRLHFFGCYAGICELCTPFLCCFLLAKELDWKLGKSIFGALLVISYIPFRLVLFPSWFFVYYYDVLSKPAVLEQLTNSEIYGFPFVIGLLTVMSYFWFVKMVKGSTKSIAKVAQQKNKRA